ncbi:chitotriosidase-1-like [Argonauta hians]
MTPGKLLPQDIDPYLCTHLIFAFAKFDSRGRLTPSGWNDVEYTNLYRQFTGLKSNNTELKTLLAIGGWSMGSAPFTAMVKTRATRQSFIKDAVNFLRKYNFDGLDLDWEYPATRGSPPQDKHRFSKLVQELRYWFGKEAVRSGRNRLLISAAVGCSPEKIDLSYDVPIISKYLDFINLMTYDLHGGWEKIMQINAPLFPRTQDVGTMAEKLTVSWVVKRWLELGASPSKLILGIPIYGRGFTFCTSQTHPGAPNCGKSTPGAFSKEAGILAFAEIQQQVDNGWRRSWDEEQKAPYAYSLIHRQWVGYDDTHSIKIKIEYLKRLQLGGTMTWSLSLDDFHNSRGSNSRFPLHRSIKKFLELPENGIKKTISPKTSQTLSYSLWDNPKQSSKSVLYETKTTNKISLLEELKPSQTIDKTSRNTPRFVPSKREKQRTLPSKKQSSVSLWTQNYPTTASFPSFEEHDPTSKTQERSLINSPILDIVFPEQNNDYNKKRISKDFNEESEYNIQSNIIPGKEDRGSLHIENGPSLHVNQEYPIVELQTIPSASTSQPEQLAPCNEDVESSIENLNEENSLTEVFQCPSLFGIYSDVMDCSSFYQCVWQVPFHYKCSPGTAWNDRIQSCDWPANTGCIL